MSAMRLSPWGITSRTLASETLRFLEMFKSPHFADVSLNQWMALTPPELVQAHLNLDETTMAALSKEKPVVVGSKS